MPQALPSQVALPFVGAGHGVQAEPQLAALLLLTQVPLQSWKPLLQAMPQAPAVQVAVPFAGTGQGVQDVPQVDGLLLLAHDPLQLWNPLLQVKLQVVPPMQVAVAFAGAVQHAPPQTTVLQAAQVLPTQAPPPGQSPAPVQPQLPLMQA
jgi:hypothetical protein